MKGQLPPTPEQGFGQAIRKMRDARGRSQQWVADQMRAKGHSWLQSTVAKTEAAERPIRLNEVVDLAAIFESNLETLVPVHPKTEREKVLAEARSVAVHVERLRRLAEDARRRLAECERDAQVAAGSLADGEETLDHLLRQAERLGTAREDQSDE